MPDARSLLLLSERVAFSDADCLSPMSYLCQSTVSRGSDLISFLYESSSCCAMKARPWGRNSVNVIAITLFNSDILINASLVLCTQRIEQFRYTAQIKPVNE